MFSYIKGKQTVGVSETYGGLPDTVEVLKRKSKISSMYLEVLPQKNHVKKAKQDDVKKLLNYFTIPEDAKNFYEDIFKEAVDNVEVAVEDVDEDADEDYDEDYD